MARPKKENKVELMGIHEKLLINKFRPDTEIHIKVNLDACLVCKNKECTKFCPSRVFIWSEADDQLLVTYENCLECGACKSGCPYEAIEYKHPSGGYGVGQGL